MARVSEGLVGAQSAKYRYKAGAAGELRLVAYGESALLLMPLKDKPFEKTGHSGPSDRNNAS